MTRHDLLALTRRIFEQPTASYREENVRRTAEDWARDIPGLRIRRDRYGNSWLHLGGPRPDAVLVAHMDHPGFEVIRPGKRAVGRFQGGVKDASLKGAPVRMFLPGGGYVRGRITSVQPEPRRSTRLVHVTARRPVPAGVIGMFDYPGFSLRGTTIRARACDDLVGVVSILAAFRELAKDRRPPRVAGLLTRAEEGGFFGTLQVANDRLVPKNAIVISLEASSRAAGAKVGAGPVIRVGDRSSIFTPHVTGFLLATARELAKRQPDFHYQRRLMDGGTCEGTPFALAGYTTGALCIALGNYHNMTPSGRIGAEFVDVRDLEGQISLLVESCRNLSQVDRGDPELSRRLAGLAREGRQRLIKTAREP